MKVSMKQKNIDFDDLRFLSNIVNIVTNVASNIDPKKMKISHIFRP